MASHATCQSDARRVRPRGRRRRVACRFFVRSDKQSTGWGCRCLRFAEVMLAAERVHDGESRKPPQERRRGLLKPSNDGRDLPRTHLQDFVQHGGQGTRRDGDREIHFDPALRSPAGAVATRRERAADRPACALPLVHLVAELRRTVFGPAGMHSSFLGVEEGWQMHVGRDLLQLPANRAVRRQLPGGPAPGGAAPGFR
jgi:hypothetical protein